MRVPTKSEIDDFQHGLFHPEASGISPYQYQSFDSNKDAMMLKCQASPEVDSTTGKGVIKGKVIYNAAANPNTKRALMNSMGNRGLLNNSDNSGFLTSLTSLSGFIPGIIEQVYYTLGVHPMRNGERLKISDFVPITVPGLSKAWANEYFKLFSADIADNGLESGVVTLGSGQINEVNTMLAPNSFPTRTWAKSISYSIFTAQQAAANFDNAGYDYIKHLETTRYKNYQLGRQQMLLSSGLKEGNNQILGLLNQDLAANPVNINNNIIFTKPFSQMSYTEINAVLSNFIAAWQTNTGCPGAFNPNRLVIAQSDLYGMGALMNPQYPLANSSIYEVVSGIFKSLTGGEGEVLPLAYCNSSFNNLGHYRYAMYRHDNDCMESAELIPYTNIISTYSVDGINYRSTAYARFTGLNVYRPNTMLYFDFPTP